MSLWEQPLLEEEKSHFDSRFPFRVALCFFLNAWGFILRRRYRIVQIRKQIKPVPDS
jgi:hypothetical protein